jgi:hypothetical protein
MLRVCENEFVSLLTDNERVGRMVNVYPFAKEFAAMPVATSGKNKQAKG